MWELNQLLFVFVTLKLNCRYSLKQSLIFYRNETNHCGCRVPVFNGFPLKKTTSNFGNHGSKGILSTILKYRFVACRIFTENYRQELQGVEMYSKKQNWLFNFQ